MVAPGCHQKGELMTKHEALTYINDYGKLTISDLLDIYPISRVAAWKTVEKLRKDGLVWIAGYRGKTGREKVYGLTARGLARLEYLNRDDGCVNRLCSCQRNRSQG